MPAFFFAQSAKDGFPDFVARRPLGTRRSSGRADFFAIVLMITDFGRLAVFDKTPNRILWELLMIAARITAVSGASAGSRTRINGFGDRYTIHCATPALCGLRGEDSMGKRRGVQAFVFLFK